MGNLSLLFLGLAAYILSTTLVNCIPCIHNGIEYEPDEVVPSSNPCEECICSGFTLEVTCYRVRCPVLRCVDPFTREGQCCPECAQGVTCWHVDNLLIGDGEFSSSRNELDDENYPCNTVCRCPGIGAYHNHGKKTQAYCSPDCE